MTSTRADVKRHGRHYTPAGLATFLAERSVGQLPGGGAIRVLDPACGDGELLFAVYRLAKEQARPITLVGYDLDPGAIAVARSRAQALDIVVDWHERDFLEDGRNLPPGSFDLVITNPPYVRTQQLGQVTAQMLAAQFGLKGRIDLTHPFVAMLPRLLRVDGVVGLLCSNRFLTTKAGLNVRAVFQESLQPVELYDLGDTRLFGAAVLPAVVVALNHPRDPSTDCLFSSAYEEGLEVVNSDSSLYEALVSTVDSAIHHDGRTVAVKVGTLIQSDSPSKPWRLSHKTGDDWLHRIEAATWRTFGDVAKIRVGIKTTADSVFISDSWNRMEPQPESDLLLPLITHDNVTPWRISDHLGTKVLYPYNLGRPKRELVDMGKYPNAMSYLESHSDRLKGRQYVIEARREWYEIWVAQQPAAWSIPKIVFPDISVNARFALDRSGAVVNGDCYWISLEDIGDEDVAYLMLAVANSALGCRFYDEVCGNKLYAGRRRWMTQYVARLPLPDPRSTASRELIRAVRALLTSDDLTDEVARVEELVEAAFEEPCAREVDVAGTLF